MTNKSFGHSPSPAEIKAARRNLGLSVSGFAKAIGYYGSEGPRLIQALEVGKRNGKIFTMSGPAMEALTYLLTIANFVRKMDGNSDQEKELEILRSVLPESIR